jgi:hypothetical protein
VRSRWEYRTRTYDDAGLEAAALAAELIPNVFVFVSLLSFCF